MTYLEIRITDYAGNPYDDAALRKALFRNEEQKYDRYSPPLERAIQEAVVKCLSGVSRVDVRAVSRLSEEELIKVYNP